MFQFGGNNLSAKMQHRCNDNVQWHKGPTHPYARRKLCMFE